MGTSLFVEDESARSSRSAPPPATANVEHGGSGNDSRNFPSEERENGATVAQRFSSQVNSLVSKADEVKKSANSATSLKIEKRFDLGFTFLGIMVQLEQKVKEVSNFYANKKQLNSSKGSSLCSRDKIDGSRKEVHCSRRMQEVMRQFGTILKQASSDAENLSF